MDKICVLLPAYNEADRIGPVLQAIGALSIEGASVQMLVIDDGSGDQTSAVARNAGARVVTFEKNRGAGAAIGRGFEIGRAENFDFLVHIDSDGQIDPAQIPLLLAPVRNGKADLAIGTRFSAGFPAYLGPLKGSCLKFTALIVGRLAGTPLTDMSCGIRCLNRTALKVTRPSFTYDYIQETLIQVLGAGLRVIEVPVQVVGEGGSVPRGLSSRFIRYSVNYLFMLIYSLARYGIRRARPREELPA